MLVALAEGIEAAVLIWLLTGAVNDMLTGGPGY
jgi:hypothetical protein